MFKRQPVNTGCCSVVVIMTACKVCLNRLNRTKAGTILRRLSCMVECYLYKVVIIFSRPFSAPAKNDVAHDFKSTNQDAEKRCRDKTVTGLFYLIFVPTNSEKSKTSGLFRNLFVVCSLNRFLNSYFNFHNFIATRVSSCAKTFLLVKLYVQILILFFYKSIK